MSKSGRKILTALREFGDALESGDRLEDRFTVRTYLLSQEPSHYDGPAVRAVRERYDLSREVFASFLCVSPSTVQSWEQDRRTPSRIARRLLDELAASPEHFRERFSHLAPGPSANVASNFEPERSNAGKSRQQKMRTR